MDMVSLLTFDGTEEVSNHHKCCNLLYLNVFHLVNGVPRLVLKRVRVTKIVTNNIPPEI
jgi:hypothetical protein